MIPSKGAPPRPAPELDRRARHHVLRGPRAPAAALRLRVRPLQGRGRRALGVVRGRRAGGVGSGRAGRIAIRAEAGGSGRSGAHGSREPRVRALARRLDAGCRPAAPGNRQRVLVVGRPGLARRRGPARAPRRADRGHHGRGGLRSAARPRPRRRGDRGRRTRDVRRRERARDRARRLGARNAGSATAASAALRAAARRPAAARWALATRPAGTSVRSAGRARALDAARPAAGEVSPSAPSSSRRPRSRWC